MSDDPWERRERERSKRQFTKGKRTEWDLVAWIAENARALSVVLAIALLLVAEIPSISGSIRGALAITGTGLLLAVAAMLREWQRSLRRILTTPISIATLALVLWSAVSFWLSPYRAQAGAELLRIVAGATAYTLVAFGLSTQERNTVAGGVIALGCGISLVDFVRMSQLENLNRMVHGVGLDYSFFGTHESVGSILAMLVPVVVSLALSKGMEEKRKWIAYAATLILTFAWLAARCRSAWVGGGVAIVVLAILVWRSPRSDRNQPRNARERIREALGSPLPVLVGATLVMAVGGGFATFLSQRAATVANVLDDASLGTRIAMWEGAARMAAQKPLLGWGLGTFPILQGWWTHLGASDFDVLRNGATHENIAHNYYFQWAAETGGVGLALHLIAILIWLFSTVQALGRPHLPTDRALALGLIAAVVGAGVDALASPAYQFHGVYAVFWLLMGLGTSATRPGDGDVQSAGKTIPLAVAAIVLGAGLAAIVPLWGKKLIAAPRDAGRGTFVLLSDPIGPEVEPGRIVTIRAKFTDRTGNPVNTSPGTTWELPSERESGSLKGGMGGFVAPDSREVQAVLRVTLPEKPGAIVQVMARFTDRAGRAYNADRIFLIPRDLNK